MSRLSTFHDWLPLLRCPYIDPGRDSIGLGGGAVVSSCLTTRRDRLDRGCEVDALNAFVMSSCEKESTRGSCDRWGEGILVIEVSKVAWSLD